MEVPSVGCPPQLSCFCPVLLYISAHSQHCHRERTMATTKTSTPIFRIEPNLKEALRTISV